MAVIVVGGNGKDVGKTSVVCGVIAALREVEWTAVKITGHDYGPYAETVDAYSKGTIWEERRSGDDTDTGKYLRAGARRALLVSRQGTDVPIDEIWRALGPGSNVIFESNRVVDVIRPDLCIAVIGGAERKASFVRLVRVADAIVMLDGARADDLPAEISRFELEAPDRLSADMVTWLREQLIKNRPAPLSEDEGHHSGE